MSPLCVLGDPRHEEVEVFVLDLIMNTVNAKTLPTPVTVPNTFVTPQQPVGQDGFSQLVLRPFNSKFTQLANKHESKSWQDYIALGTHQTEHTRGHTHTHTIHRGGRLHFSSFFN